MTRIACGACGIRHTHARSKNFLRRPSAGPTPRQASRKIYHLPDTEARYANPWQQLVNLVPGPGTPALPLTHEYSPHSPRVYMVSGKLSSSYIHGRTREAGVRDKKHQQERETVKMIRKQRSDKGNSLFLRLGTNKGERTELEFPLVEREKK